MSRVLRALFVSEGALGIGTVGLARVEPAVRAGLAGRDDVEARYITLPPQGPVATVVAHRAPWLARRDLDLQTVRWHAVQALRARRMLERELRSSPADVIHVVSHSIALGMVGIMRRVPTLLSLDVAIWPYRQMELWTPLYRHSRAMITPSIALERRALEAAALVVPWSEWARADVERQFPGVRCTVHEQGVDLELYRPAPRRARTRPRVLFAGGRFVVKGGQDALDAAQLVGLDRFDLDVVTFEDVAVPSGVRLHRNIPREAVLDLMQQADIVLAPTHGDASPFLVLEAMACGAAVISTTIGAIPELLGDGAGMLVAPRDPRALADTLARLVDDPRLCDELGRTARRRVEERFDAQHQTARLIELMREAHACFPAAS